MRTCSLAAISRRKQLTAQFTRLTAHNVNYLNLNLVKNVKPNRDRLFSPLFDGGGTSQLVVSSSETQRGSEKGEKSIPFRT